MGEGPGKEKKARVYPWGPHNTYPTVPCAGSGITVLVYLRRAESFQGSPTSGFVYRMIEIKRGRKRTQLVECEE